MSTTGTTDENFTTLTSADGDPIRIPSGQQISSLSAQLERYMAEAIDKDHDEVQAGLRKSKLIFGCGGLNGSEAGRTLQMREQAVRQMVDMIMKKMNSTFVPMCNYVPEIVNKSCEWKAVNQDLKVTEEKVHTLGLEGWTGAGGEAYRKQKQDQLDDITAQRKLAEHNKKALDSVALLQSLLLQACHEQLSACVEAFKEAADIPVKRFGNRAAAKNFYYYGRTADLYRALQDFQQRQFSLDHGELFAPVDSCQRKLSSELESAAKGAMEGNVKDASYSQASNAHVDSGMEIYSEEDGNALRHRSKISKKGLFG